MTPQEIWVMICGGLALTALAACIYLSIGKIRACRVCMDLEIASVFDRDVERRWVDDDLCARCAALPIERRRRATR